MTRQYIGARYVPRFYEGSSGTDWTANTQYEPLTIVTRNGNSYTSKKPVPASVGAPESNPEYWASTGIYNAQVEQLQKDISNLADTVQEDISNLADTVQDNYDTLNAKIGRRRYVLIGDSYAWGELGGGVQGEGWPIGFKTYLGLSDTDCFVSAQGGTGFVGNTGTFISQLNALAPSVTDPDTITDVLVAGGYNDHGAAPSLIVTNINAFYVRARELFPNATMWCAFVGCSRDTGTTGTDIRQELKRAKASYVSTRAANTIKNIDLALNLNPTYYANDIIHFNNAGYKAMGEYLAERVTGGENSYAIFYSSAALSGVDGTTPPKSLPYWVTDDELMIWLEGTYAFGNSLPGGGSAPYNLAAIAAPFFGRRDIVAQAPAEGYCIKSGTYYPVRVGVAISAGKLVILNETLTGSGYFDFSGAANITFYPKQVLRFTLNDVV